MTEDNKRANIALAVKEAEDAMRAARLLLDGGLYKAAVSRAYYCALNYARALLLTEGIEPKTHGGVQSALYHRFVQTGRLEPVVARIVQQLEGDRRTADYEAAAIYTAEMAGDDLDEAERFGASVRAVLTSAGYL